MPENRSFSMNDTFGDTEAFEFEANPSHPGNLARAFSILDHVTRDEDNENGQPEEGDEKGEEEEAIQIDWDELDNVEESDGLNIFERASRERRRLEMEEGILELGEHASLLLSHRLMTLSEEQEGLTPDELKGIRLLAHNIRHNQSRESLEDLIEILEEDKLPSVFKLKSRLEELSGLTPDIYHCCVNTCLCFSGQFSDLEMCPVCEEPRYDARRRPRNIFKFLPIIPRLQNLF